MNKIISIILIIITLLSTIAVATETTWRHSGFEVWGYDLNFTGTKNITNILNINNVNFSDFYANHMSNPATADLNMGNYNITGLGQNESYSYLIWTDGTNYYAKNGSTGKVDYSGTDANSIIQSAINGNYRVVIVSSGIYDDIHLVMNKTGVRLIGSGRGTIFHVSAGQNGITLNNNAYQNEISNLQINGEDVGDIGIFISHGTNTIINRLWVYNFVSWGIRIDFNHSNHVFNSVIQYNGVNTSTGGILIGGDSTNTTNIINIERSLIELNTIGIFARASSLLNIEKNTIEANDYDGIRIDKLNSVRPLYVNINNNYFEHNNYTETSNSSYDVISNLTDYVSLQDNWICCLASKTINSLYVTNYTSEVVVSGGGYFARGTDIKGQKKYVIGEAANGAEQSSNSGFYANSTHFTINSKLYLYDNTSQIWNGSAWDWFLMPSKVFGTGVTNHNNGSITITDSVYNASYMTNPATENFNMTTYELYGSTISNQSSNYLAGDLLGITTAPKFLNTLTGTPVTNATNMIDVSGAGHNGIFNGTWVATQRINKGFGWALNPDGTTNHINLGDSDDFSFGNSTNDTAFTIAGVIEIVNTATIQSIISKWDSTSGLINREWWITISDEEKLILQLRDNSLAVGCSNTTNSALSIGFHTFVITYSGIGGATAADGIDIYIDGALVAGTASNNTNYVAMENLATEVWIGAEKGTNGSPRYFMTGDFTPPIIDKEYVWSAADVNRFHQYMKGVYNL